jgi:hypothetical protein
MNAERGDVLRENHECYERWCRGHGMIGLTSTKPVPCHSKIFPTMDILHRGPFPISLCRLIIHFLTNLEIKINNFPHICSLSFIQQAYMQVAPLQLAYIRIYARKYKNGVKFPCNDKRSLILGLPYTGNVLTCPFSFILKAIREQF